MHELSGGNKKYERKTGDPFRKYERKTTSQTKRGTDNTSTNTNPKAVALLFRKTGDPFSALRQVQCRYFLLMEIS